MAGEEKKEKKEKKSDSHSEGGAMPFADALFWILLVLVFFSLLNATFGAINFSLPDITSIFSLIFDKIQVFSIFLSLAFFLGIIYCNFKLGELASHGHGGGHSHDDPNQGHEASHEVYEKPHFKHEPNKRWQNVLQRISSPNEGDWRLAIIESDIILNEMLGRMGYRGEGIGEKLKQVEKSDFHTVQSAWEAHKIRNEIAHGGSDYHLSRRDAERAIDLFKEVFEEFHFI